MKIDITRKLDLLQISFWWITPLDKLLLSKLKSWLTTYISEMLLINTSGHAVEIWTFIAAFLKDY
jgi:hypothetical protein